MAEEEQLAADEIGGERSGAEHDREREDDAQAGQVESEKRVAAQVLRQQQQRLVHRVDEQLHHP